MPWSKSKSADELGVDAEESASDGDISEQAGPVPPTESHEIVETVVPAAADGAVRPFKAGSVAGATCSASPRHSFRRRSPAASMPKQGGPPAKPKGSQMAAANAESNSLVPLTSHTLDLHDASRSGVVVPTASSGDAVVAALRRLPSMQSESKGAAGSDGAYQISKTMRGSQCVCIWCKVVAIDEGAEIVVPWRLQLKNLSGGDTPVPLGDCCAACFIFVTQAFPRLTYAEIYESATGEPPFMALVLKCVSIAKGEIAKAHTKNVWKDAPFSHSRLGYLPIQTYQSTLKCCVCCENCVVVKHSQLKSFCVKVGFRNTYIRCAIPWRLKFPVGFCTTNCNPKGLQ